MSDRSSHLHSLRPQIPTATISEFMGADERFQNQTLRPIIKFQNDLLLAVLQNYIVKHKNRFFALSLENRLAYIENAVQKDIKFRNALKGILIGQFTVEEYTQYIENSSDLNKRMMNLVIYRLQDQIQLFEDAQLV